MLEIGSIVKINSKICDIFQISIPYGIIKNFYLSNNLVSKSDSATCNVRINEIDWDNNDFVFHHYILEIRTIDLEEV